jgi:hypothetical protein
MHVVRGSADFDGFSTLIANDAAKFVIEIFLDDGKDQGLSPLRAEDDVIE